MTDEDESTDAGTIAAEREILKFLGDREANDAAERDRGTSSVNQFAQHPAPVNPVKQTKAAEELAAMIHQDLSQNPRNPRNIRLCSVSHIERSIATIHSNEKPRPRSLHRSRVKLR
jgi:hypothetical protein